jgi:hypothetical protein
MMGPVRAKVPTAHILPYNGPATNHPANGLPLRADLRVLFDLGLIAVDPSTFAVVVAPALRQTTYAELEGINLRLPKDERHRPNGAALGKQSAGCAPPQRSQDFLGRRAQNDLNNPNRNESTRNCRFRSFAHPTLSIREVILHLPHSTVNSAEPARFHPNDKSVSLGRS